MTNKSELTDTIINRYLQKTSHAYLFITNGDFDYQELLIKFVIKILFKENINNYDIVYNQIKNNSFPEVKTIKADGLWIKKDQLSELKKEFSTKSLNSSKKVYIINEAEKLNASSANSILKFLEEPEDNIVAILTTNNINNVLSTITSRCQIINIRGLLDNNNNDLYSIFKDFISKEKYNQDDYGNIFVENAITFLLKLEDISNEMILFTKSYFHKKFTNREEIELVIQIMILFYKDVLRYLINGSTSYFKEYVEDIRRTAGNNNTKDIMNKINILNNKKELVKNNVNINLLIDTIIFDLGGEKL